MQVPLLSSPPAPKNPLNMKTFETNLLINSNLSSLSLTSPTQSQNATNMSRNWGNSIVQQQQPQMSTFSNLNWNQASIRQPMGSMNPSVQNNSFNPLQNSTLKPMQNSSMHSMQSNYVNRSATFNPSITTMQPLHMSNNRPINPNNSNMSNSFKPLSSSDINDFLT